MVSGRPVEARPRPALGRCRLDDRVPSRRHADDVRRRSPGDERQGNLRVAARGGGVRHGPEDETGVDRQRVGAAIPRERFLGRGRRRRAVSRRLHLRALVHPVHRLPLRIRVTARQARDERGRADQERRQRDVRGEMALRPDLPGGGIRSRLLPGGGTAGVSQRRDASGDAVHVQSHDRSSRGGPARSLEHGRLRPAQQRRRDPPAVRERVAAAGQERHLRRGPGRHAGPGDRH